MNNDDTKNIVIFAKWLKIQFTAVLCSLVSLVPAVLNSIADGNVELTSWLQRL